MRTLLLGVLAVTAHAQFTQIATTDDASHVYVATTFVIDGVAGIAGQASIYQIDSGKVSVFAHTDPPQVVLGAPSLNGIIGGPQVSADGSIAGYSTSNICRDDPCSSQSAESYLKLPAAQDLGVGSLHLSRNGRWALLAPQDNFTSSPGAATLMDLQSGTSVAVPAGPLSIRLANADNWSVASDGSVLTGDTVWKAGHVTDLSVPSLHAWLALSDDGTTAILSIADTGSRLVAHDIASGNEVVFADSRNNGGVVPSGVLSVTSNGRFVLYGASSFASGVVTGSAYVADTVMAKSYRIPLSDGETMMAGALNGPGTIAVIGTSLGRLLRVDLADGQPGAITPIVPQTLYVSAGGGIPLIATGSLVRLTGSLTGTVDSLQGHIRLDDLALPILAVSGNLITAQVPWEVKAGQKDFQIDLPSQSQFHPPTGSVVVAAGRPQFEFFDVRTAFLGGVKIIAEDFSGPVTKPLPAGAIVHAYMTGLGPVNGAVTTGVPADASMLNPIQGTITCRFAPQASDAQTLFAGLAPSLIGIYQVDFKLADEGAPVNITGLNCRASGPGFSATLGVNAPLQ